MPIISQFYGISIRMYFLQSEHNQPHIHAIYGDYAAAISIKDKLILSGNLPEKAYKMVCEWISLYEKELHEIYNYKELAKLYKEQTQLGYSKMLPQIALGQSQSSILATAHFENEVLELVKVFVPPMSSNTMSGKNPAGGGNGDNKNPKAVPGEEKKAGRKEKEDDQKSEKTIANRESMN